jgi:hypothetical protein
MNMPACNRTDAAYHLPQPCSLWPACPAGGNLNDNEKHVSLAGAKTPFRDIGEQSQLRSRHRLDQHEVFARRPIPIDGENPRSPPGRNVAQSQKVRHSRGHCDILSGSLPRPVSHLAAAMSLRLIRSNLLAYCLVLAATGTAAAADDVRPVNFTTDIVPILSKYGCNSGGCHGKAIGQNGFKLSLFGFDPAFDYVALVHEGRGRRVSAAAPDDSVLLLKASGGMPHGGGMRFSTDSDAYKLLKQWIEQGLPDTPADGPHETKLKVTPASMVGPARQAGPRSGADTDSRSRPAGETYQLKAVVHYSDGSTRDVTPLARYDSQQPAILSVSFGGLVETTGKLGEGCVMVRYQDLVATASVLLPYGPLPADDAFASFQPKNFVDEKVLTKWKALHIAPSPQSDDAEFMRRLFLDTLGTLPTPQEVRDFLADASPDKRDKLVDAVLERPEYADLWAQYWGEILRSKQGDGQFKDHTVNFGKWLRQSLAENKPFDRFARELLTVMGKRAEHPEMDWWRQAINNQLRVEDTAQAFLGLRVSCANCHNHPFENISQTDYWQFAAFFAKVGSVTYGSVDEIKLNDEGVIKHPRTDQPLSPQAFGGAKFEYVKGEDPRVKLADWMTSPHNPYFARAIVNRMWGHYLSVGLVDPVDDMRATNPPSNPELLDTLAKDFIEHKFDLKHLQRTILKSRAYGLSSVPTEYNRADTRNYARHYPRRLSPHVLMDALSFATGTEAKFDDFAEVKKAILLPSEKGRSDFLDMFGRSQRDTPCECETRLAPNLSQVLYLLHSEELQRKLSDQKGFVAQITMGDKPNAEIVEELFLRTFSRRPTADELASAVGLLEKSMDKKGTVEDLLWSLVNAKEFLFNH